MSVQDQDSNRVYVVSISSETPRGWTISWIDIVQNEKSYFHPVGGSGWPVAPPNYLGFRYYGMLQSIHHVNKYEVIRDLGDACAGIPRTPVGPHYCYQLGPAIVPSREVRTGNLFRNGRVWCAIDLLLTSSTISEARDRTKKRAALQ